MLLLIMIILNQKKVFTHIGFKNIKGILYEIDKSDLMKWTN